MGYRILVTGGAGYVGSQTCTALIDAGYDVVILDNFSNAKRDVPDRLSQITGAQVPVVDGDIRCADTLARTFRTLDIDGVVHLAALKAVGDSVLRPLEYYDVNVSGTAELVRAMAAVGCRTLVFSSSATVYGLPDETPTPETSALRGMNPYGDTKIACERMLGWMARVDPRWTMGVLRYFNPAGAHVSALIGENPCDIPNNLMPYIARVAFGDLPEIAVFGNDYPTPDGTGIRDYIHVADVARGHVLSLDRLFRTGYGHTVNLGSGTGHSVLDVIREYGRAAGCPLPYRVVDRRAGDVPVYVARADRAYDVLGFRTEHSLAAMCSSSWAWMNADLHARPRAATARMR